MKYRSVIVLPVLLGWCLLFALAWVPSLGGTSPQEALRRVDGIPVPFRVLGHASVYFLFEGKSIYVDPWGQQADFATLPKASLILITHEHPDHLDLKAIEKIRTENTVLVMTEKCLSSGVKGLVMKNGDTKTLQGVGVEAVPAYNLNQKRSDGQPFHPKGEGNGYVLTFDKKRVYVAGDTENIPEMEALRDISLAFLPMNLPYTMSPAMTSKAALSFKPKVLVPYHYGQTNLQELKDLLQGKGITVLANP
jgi:L-ascorbate metabolism protein UlaG (beta-lactamase superfamily)